MTNKQVELQTVTFSNGKFSISAQEAKNIAVSLLVSYFDIGGQDRDLPYVNDKGQVCQDEYFRNDVETKVLRKATVMDEMAEKVISEFAKNACKQASK